MDLVSRDLCFPETVENRIIKILLRRDAGAMTLNSGLELEINPDQLHMLDEFKFDYHVQFVSKKATVDWVGENDLVWDSLRQCVNASFNGSYPDDLICGLVQRCSSVKDLSFTYFAAPSFVTILEHVTSPNLTELTAHAVGTDSNTAATFDALQKLGRRTGCSIRRMMLIFADAYPGSDVGVDAHQIFGNSLASDSIVHVLFACEGDSCMSQLIDQFGYKHIGSISMVANLPTVDVFDEAPIFERYYLFKKVIDSITWIIGCKKKNGQDFYHFIPPKISSKTRIPPRFAGVERFDPPKHDKEHQTILMHQDVYGRFARPWDRVYPPRQYEDESNRDCCSPKNLQFEGPLLFSMPIWDSVRVAEVIYFEGDTRFRLSNGLIVQLAEMAMESCFFRTVFAAHRTIFTCSTHDRRWIEANGLREFLRAARQVDFQGWWFSIAQENILERIPPETLVLSLMRMKADKRPLRFLIRAAMLQSPNRARPKISKFFYDARDTVDDSLGSIYNGIAYQNRRGFDTEIETFHELSSVIVMAKKVSGKFKHAKMSFEHFVKGILDFTAVDATITILVQEAVCLHDKQTLGFGHSKPVIAPLMFSSRFERDPWSFAMKQSMSKYRNRTWVLIEPL